MTHKIRFFFFQIIYILFLYILTQRDSYDLLNSDLKMYYRTLKLYDDRLKHHMQCNETSQYNIQQANDIFQHWHTRYETTFLDCMNLI